MKVFGIKKKVEQDKENESHMVMFGMSEADLISYLNENLRWTSMGKETSEGAKTALSMSMLSDVQEMMIRNHSEAARTLINRVKYLLMAELEEIGS